ncbi:asparagine synthase (glutamine-hydrolyzing) [Acidiphilium sp.]|uniref:asparagine synthase (glutamine-hydrolyzing) n=1 Tax=Acidiphilium sp. TaxID=527 RepID=UPI00258DB710|nr:asparagine synthase (glutamine-hydrolyzing) [Acidiphilium sp.]
MCGLTGLFRSDAVFARSGPVDGALLQRMTDAIAHRGPDSEGLALDGQIGLGFRRLAVIDLAGSPQPMHSADGAQTIVFNGEIYNFRQLAAELAVLGQSFRTRGDTETILNGWRQWGAGVLDRLDGMFAFALWDRRTRQLLLARDRIGKKPLYYGTAPDGTLAFGSELAALRPVPGLTDRLDPTAIEDFLALGYIPDPASAFRDIRKLPPAHAMLIEADRPLPAPFRYWSLPRAHPPADAREAADVMGGLFEDAVARRMIADVPLGAFLSGGIDSGCVVALAARRTDRPLRCFTIGFPEADEREAASEIARHCGAEHETAEMSAHTILGDAAAQAAMFGEPFGDHSSVPSRAVAALARRHVTVALSGDGGDEAFGGYRRYRFHHLTDAARRMLPGPVRRRVIGTIARAYPKLDAAPRWLRAKSTLTELSLDSAEAYYRSVGRSEAATRHALFSAGFRRDIEGHDPATRFHAVAADHEDDDALRVAQRIDLETWLPGDILVKTDRTSMAVGLEVRCPLLDPTLLAFGLALPADLKLRGGRGKAILRDVAASLLPASVMNRPKQGFAATLGPDMRKAAPQLREMLCGPQSALLASTWFDGPAVARLLDAHASGRRDHTALLWHLLVLDSFLADWQHQRRVPHDS